MSEPGAGRGLRCSRDVGGGELVLEDWAVVIGEGTQTLLQHNNVSLVPGPSERCGERDCYGCYVAQASVLCGCGLGFCSQACRGR